MHAKRFLWLGAYAGCLLPPRGAGGAAACAPGPHREVVVTRPRVVVIHDTRSYGSPDQLCDKTTGRRTDLDFRSRCLVEEAQLTTSRGTRWSSSVPASQRKRTE